MPSEPTASPPARVRVYLARADADAPRCARLHDMLKRFAEAEGFALWHSGLTLAGSLVAERDAERARADLRVALLSVDLFSDPELDALLACAPGLAVKIGPCPHDLPKLRDWPVIDATPADDQALTRAAGAIRHQRRFAPNHYLAHGGQIAQEDQGHG